MPQIVKPYQYTNGQLIDANQLDANLDTLYTAINGNLDGSNLKTGLNFDSNGIINVKSPAYNASGSALATTGSITSGSFILTLTAALDFINGQGISIAGAGVAGATLVTSIANGAGTTQLTLNTVASTTVTSVAVIHEDTVALAAARDAAITAKAPLVIPAGTYNASSFPQNSSINIIGAGMGKTILQSTNGGNLFLQIAGTASVENVLLQDLSIYGGATDIGGLALGTATYYVAYCVFERVEIKNFSKANAYGLSLNSVQEFHSIDSKYNNNYDNIYRPTTGYVTTCTFSGQAGHIGLAVRYGAYINDTPGGSIKFRDQIFEVNASNAIYSPAGTQCNIQLNSIYFEGNNSSAGTATIDIGGSNSTAYTMSSLTLDKCEFHTSGNIALPALLIDRVSWMCTATSSLFNGIITTTANTRGILMFNSISQSSVNFQTIVEGLLGSHMAWENSVSNGRVIIGNPYFVSGLTVGQLFAISTGIQMPNTGFGGAPHASRQILVPGTNPIMQMYVTNGTANKRKYELRAIGAAGFEGLQLRVLSDDESTIKVLMNFMYDGSNGFGGTGSTLPNPNSIMDFSSNNTTKAVLFPVMTTTQKNAIPSPTAGMVVFDSTLGKLCIYTGAAWQTITSA